MSNSHNWLKSLGGKCRDLINVIRDIFTGNRGPYGDGDVEDLVGNNVNSLNNNALSDKYLKLKTMYPQIGPLNSYNESIQGDSVIRDFDGMAAVVCRIMPYPAPTSYFEVHGGIYSAWKASGGVLGPLGRPVSDEIDYHGPDARSGDRISEFMNGVVVWRADTGKTEIRPYLWHDEFEGLNIDASKWSFDIGTGSNGWGNRELQYYTDRPQNAYVTGGVLHICARKEQCNGSNYTSARLISKNKFCFKYGMIEARIALPVGQGIWPAFWMLGANSDFEKHPACGEIDIVEAINSEHVVYGTTHWWCNGHAQHGKSTKDFYGASKQIDVTEFHVYRLEWNEKRIAMYVDNFKYNEISIENSVGGTDAFHKPFYLLLNVAVGGTWPGFVVDDSKFPNEMLVDYIRVSNLT